MRFGERMRSCGDDWSFVLGQLLLCIELPFHFVVAAEAPDDTGSMFRHLDGSRSRQFAGSIVPTSSRHV